MQRNGMAVIFNLLTETICQSCESAHPHPHRKILSLHKRGRNVRRVRVSGYCRRPTSNASRWTIASASIVLQRRTVDFDEHRIIDFATESILHCIFVNAVSIACQLNSISYALRKIVYENPSCLRASRSDHVGNNQFRVGANRRPCPNIAVAELPLLFLGNILLLCVTEGPSLIDLYSASVDIANLSVVISSSGAARIFQQFQYCVLRYSGHSDDGVYRVTFNQRREDLCSFRNAQPVHKDIISTATYLSR